MRVSYWEREVFFRKANALVVGGGIVGLSTAIYVKRKHPKWRVVLVERDSISSGASTKNAGFACIGSAGELIEDLSTMSSFEVFSIVRKRFEGLNNLRKLLGDKALKYDACGGFELFRKSDSLVFDECLTNLHQLNSDLWNVIGEKPFSEVRNVRQKWSFASVKGAIYNSVEGSVHTGWMMHNLYELARSERVEFLNGLNITEIEDNGKHGLASFEEGQFEAEHIFVCTNAFTKQLLPNLEVKPARNQVIVTEAIPGLDLSGTFHLDRGYIYFRPIDQRILLGGMRNLAIEAETSEEFGVTDHIQNALELFLHEVILPGRKIKIEHRWSGILGVGESKSPIVQDISPRIHAGVRLGGIGVAIGSLVGKELAEMID